MPKTFFATAPNGQQFKRTSQNRTYPWAVLVGPPTAEALAAICDQQAAAYDSDSAKIQAGLDNFLVVIKPRFRDAQDGIDYDGKPTYTAFVATLVGSRIDAWCNSKGETDRGYCTFGDYEEARKNVISVKREILFAAQQAIFNNNENAAKQRVLSADYRAKGISARENKWEAIRWTSRFELGKSYIESEFGFYSQRGQELILVDTSVKEAKVKA
jgi:hypothetical protein